MKWLGKIKTNSLRGNKNKYCEFHRDHGYNTEDCFQLKEQIADLMKSGYLRKFVVDRLRSATLEQGYIDNRPTTRDIQTIHEGVGLKGCSTSLRKRHAREEKRRVKRPTTEASPPITFTSKDLKVFTFPMMTLSSCPPPSLISMPRGF